MPKKKAKKKVVEMTDLEKIALYFNVDLIPEPTRQFEVGDTEFVLGGLENPVILDKFYGGKLYKIEADDIAYGKYVGRKVDIHSWVYMFSKVHSEVQLHNESDIWLSSLRSQIGSLLHTVYSFGVNLDPDYQRDLVWSIEDKRLLIASILNDVPIGRFVFNKLPYSEKHNYLYEIIDGKQRLTTICEFIEDRFTYNGMKYSELHPHDRIHIDNFPVEVVELENATREQVLRTFLRVNETGKPISKEQLDKVKNLLSKEKK